ncbi:MAG: hypothetical protein WBW94_03395 [Anaerolineales bacterium]
MKITDEFYSNLNDGEVKNRIGALGKATISDDQDDSVLIREFLEWVRRKKPKKNHLQFFLVIPMLLGQSTMR